MRTYLVGGAVRDIVLGRKAKDHDYVVVGGTEQEMLDKGFVRVGAQFPTFLHPTTKDEYALARTEKSCGLKHTDFTVDFNPSVTLEQDLYRRDLTMNAMAYDFEYDMYIDPYGGAEDIFNGVIRHVSEYFADDPLRILRAARFAAQYDFKIHPDTMGLMHGMVLQGKHLGLTIERVWNETVKAMKTNKPSVYFNVLDELGILHEYFPFVYDLHKVPQPEAHHPEIDTYVHVMMTVDKAAELSNNNPLVVYAALVHDLGKGLTPADEWPHHRGHEEAGVKLVLEMSNNLKVPSLYKKVGVLSSRYHLDVHRAMELNHKTLVDKLEALGALRDTESFRAVLLSAEADSKGRLGYEDREYPQYEYMMKASMALKALKYSDLAEQYQGKRLLDAIRARKTNAMKAFKKQWNNGRD